MVGDKNTGDISAGDKGPSHPMYTSLKSLCGFLRKSESNNKKVFLRLAPWLILQNEQKLEK
jgi:hypothetical protein